ncbi:hypothetical protein WFJ45_22080, partial [Salmonella enterica subsp. enterica serovar Minnesota]|uniref:hypothetical protein n=1 Tax=Salmonella enterica TaxID=28901 RepID=UPI003D281872
TGVVVDRSRAEELGRHSRVDAVLTGRVLAYEYDRAPGSQQAKMPSVIMSVRLVSSRDGKILWIGNVDGTRDA